MMCVLCLRAGAKHKNISEDLGAHSAISIHGHKPVGVQGVVRV